MMPPAVRFTLEQSNEAWEAWRFNCGPSALCAVTSTKPEDALRVLPQFRERGYTNPTMMRAGLKALGATWKELRSESGAVNLAHGVISPLPAFGLVRVQWGGRWTNPGVPIRARYRYSHWIAIAGDQIFDINAMCVGGWLPFQEWAGQLVPWLLREVYGNKPTGQWWSTHCWEVER